MNIMKYVSRIFFAAIAIGCYAQTLQSASYYASPSGTGNGVSYTSPATLAVGLSKLSAGDSLFLLGGQYDLNEQVTISMSGYEQKRTYIGACKGERPIFDFRTQPHGKNGVSITGCYIHVKGLVIRYAGYKGLHNTGSYNIMEMLDIYGNCDSGIQQKGGNNNLILNCDSHDNFDFLSMSGSACDYGGNADGFADKQYTNSPGNTYIGCRAWNNSDDGWDHFQRVGGTTTFKGCICFNNGPQYYDMSRYARRKTDDYWFRHFMKDTVVTTINGNSYTCSIRHYYNNGNGNGFKLGGRSTKHNVILYNCLSLGNRVKGFDQNSNAGKMEIYNCISYLNGVNYGFYHLNGDTLIIKNCISLDSKSHNLMKASVITQSGNTWNGGSGCSDADFISLDTTLVLLPRNADGSLPVTNLLRIRKK